MITHKKHGTSTECLDMNGHLICMGDEVLIPWMHPVDLIHSKDTFDYYAKVTFFNGSFGFWGHTEFVPLFKWHETEEGGYIANQGHKTIYSKRTILLLAKFASDNQKQNTVNII